MPKGFELTAGPPTFKYRGWFINDEDLLAGWAPDPMGENIFSLAVWDRIYETILRLRGNMIVPGTFTFADERCRELAAKRGLILNDHHINVVGLNTFQWPEEIPYSYLEHPEILEKAWKACIDAMKDWEVVWTVGYRGKHDRPFWHDDKSANTPEARGKVISDAIAKQVELVRAVQPEADIITNLWGEGVVLFDAGHIKIPEGVHLVWPDNGHGVIRDGGKVKAGQGTYYHTAMLNGMANQLTELVRPSVSFSELGRFVRAEATFFFLVNVSDIRLVPLSTDAVMKFAWNADPYMEQDPGPQALAFYEDWSRRQFGNEVAEDVAAIYRDYFRIPYIRDHNYGEHRGLVHYSRLVHHTLKALASDQPPTPELLDDAKTVRKYIAESVGYLADLDRRAQALRPSIPAGRQDFYRAHVLTQIATHRGIADALNAVTYAIEACGHDDRPAAIAHAIKALQGFDEVLAAQRATEYGRWQAFYFGEMFTFFQYIRDITRSLIYRLEGRPPVVRLHPPHYKALYRYQEAAGANYPLLYPSEHRLAD